MASIRTAALEAMIEEATVDAYNDDEQLAGLYTMIEYKLAVPFTTTVLGVEVNVRNVDLTVDSIVAICSRGRDRQRIDLLDLPLPTPPPAPAGDPVLYRGGGHGDGQQQPAGVHRDVLLAAVDVLAGVVAAAGPGHRLGSAH
jgi:hypothetical protein